MSCETGPHYLLLCDEDLQEEGRFKMNPPLRSREDREALLAGIVDGTIEVIATDQRPAYRRGEVARSGAERHGHRRAGDGLPLLYTYLVKRGVMTLERLVELMSVNPRRLFALEGGIAEGDPADFTVLDLDMHYAIDPATFLSKGHATPFAGWQGRWRRGVDGGWRPRGLRYADKRNQTDKDRQG